MSDLDALRTRLTDHYLAQIVCDHERGLDNPICACSRVHLGWHPSVGAAVAAWVDHVMDDQAVGAEIEQLRKAYHALGTDLATARMALAKANAARSDTTRGDR